MCLITTQPEHVEIGDRIMFENDVWIVKSFNSDSNCVYDLLCKNAAGEIIHVITDSVTIIR